MLRIEDDYTAYCFDEACALIMSKIDNDEKPKFKKIKEKQKNQVKKKARMLPSEIYKKFDKQ